MVPCFKLINRSENALRKFFCKSPKRKMKKGMSLLMEKESKEQMTQILNNNEAVNHGKQMGQI